MREIDCFVSPNPGMVQLAGSVDMMVYMFTSDVLLKNDAANIRLHYFDRASLHNEAHIYWSSINYEQMCLCFAA